MFAETFEFGVLSDHGVREALIIVSKSGIDPDAGLCLVLPAQREEDFNPLITDRGKIVLDGGEDGLDFLDVFGFHGFDRLALV
jgi:hypothetical protein